MSGVVDQILEGRGVKDIKKRLAFCNPDYDLSKYDAFLLPDMAEAVNRLVRAKNNKEFIYIYGDYDIDGLTATAILLDAFKKFGLNCAAYIPNRFTEGYGLSGGAIEELAKKGAQLIVTVDCGSLSHSEIELANGFGLDVIVTDHHSVSETMPPAVAVVNPKRSDHNYPFTDLAGCGVAFKLVQALQTRLDGLADGQEKWLLDLVAFGTVCDVVNLLDENRTNVFWGLQVLRKTRRPGLKAILQVTGVDLEKINSRTLGFVIGPHLNAAGRLKTAKRSLDLLLEEDPLRALEIANELHEMNVERRQIQDRIFKEACKQAEKFTNDPVLVLSGKNWSHGVIGIVAAKLLEKFGKPTFVIEEIDEEAKGSARSYGDFSAVEAIKAADKWLIKGGGHRLAAGITLKTSNILDFRKAVNDFYNSQNFKDQSVHLEPHVDAITDTVEDFNEELATFLNTLEPFGHGNPEPVFYLQRAIIKNRREIGKDGSHLKIEICDSGGKKMSLIGFSKAEQYRQDAGEEVAVWFTLLENEWRGVKKYEGQLIKLIILN